MAKCNNCTNLYNLSDENDVIVGKWCPKINDSPDIEAERECRNYKRMTQGDRIRAMSDEDLAMNMMCPNENGIGEIECDKSNNCNCYECILKWLQSEVEEVNNPDHAKRPTSMERKYAEDIYREKAMTVAIQSMEKLQEYEKLGTLEEVRKAVKKQIPKKVTSASNGDKLRFGTCPSCNKRISNVEGGNYCQNCGNAIDWR